MLLMLHGADINAKDINGNTPVVLAKRQGVNLEELINI